MTDRDDAQVTIDSPAAVNRESVTDRRAQFRYGAVFLLTLAAVVFVIAAPSAGWSRAVTLAIESAALVVAIATSRERERVRHRRALAVGIVMVVLILGVGIGVVSEQLTAILLALVTAAVPVEIVRGVVRLLRERGVTLRAVAGALAIYLSIGLVFAWIISFITHVDSAAYFAAAHQRHGGGPCLFQLHRADDDRLWRLLRRDPSRTRPRGDRDAHRPALSRHRHRAADRQLRRKAENDMRRALWAIVSPCILAKEDTPGARLVRSG